MSSQFAEQLKLSRFGDSEKSNGKFHLNSNHYLDVQR